MRLNRIVEREHDEFLGNINDGGSSLGNENGPYSNYYNRRADYGPLANDIRHRVSLSWLYELPFGAGKRWLIRSLG